MSLSNKHEHPQIEQGKQYLVKLEAVNGRGYRYYAGTFSRQWYGWSFDGWIGASGLQFDEPDTNLSRWVQIWEIVEES
jgi:hypothetical protein